MSKSEIIEEWRDITGYEGLYQVSNLGRVRSLDRTELIHRKGSCFYRHFSSKILHLNKTGKGYLRVDLCKTINGKQNLIHKSVHRLVAESFIPNPENKKTVNHIDGNKTNNCFENLEWNTYSENVKHSFINGLEKPYKRIDGISKKLTDSQVIEIRSEHALYKKSSTELAKKYNVSHTYIKKIISRERRNKI